MTHPASTSAEWIFDVESEKIRTDFFLHAEKTKIVLGC
jgi:hypothetical protein